MNYITLSNEVQDLLMDKTSGSQAVSMSKYMSDQFIFYGMISPLRNQIVKKIKAVVKPFTFIALPEFIQLLWAAPYRECKYIALDMMGSIRKKMDVDWIDFLEQLILTKSWWDTVDFLALNLTGSIFSRNADLGNTYTDRWIESDNFWLQRTALFYQLRL